MLEEGSSESSLTFHNEAESLVGEVSSNLTFDGEVLEEGSNESSLTFHNEAEPLVGEVSSNLTFDGEVLEEGSSESSLTFHNEVEPLVGEVSSNLTIDGEVLEEGLVEEVSCDETNEIDSKIGLMLIYSFMVQHHLTRQGREDLLSLLQILIPNRFPSSLYLFL